MTRAITHLFQAEWSQAWALHPLAPLVVMATAAALIWWLGVRKLSWRPISRQILDASLIGTSLVFFAVWVLRMSNDTLPSVSGLFNR